MWINGVAHVGIAVDSEKMLKRSATTITEHKAPVRNAATLNTKAALE